MVKVIIAILISLLLYIPSIISFMYSEYDIAYSSTTFSSFPPPLPSNFTVFPKASNSSTPSPKISESSVQELYSFEYPPSCKPSSFGYTYQEYWRIFENKSFESCESRNQVNKQVILIENSTLSMPCFGWYYLGTPVSEESMGITEYQGKPVKYHKPVQLKNIEWAYGSCSSESKIEGAAYKLIENPEVKTRVQRKKQELEMKFGLNQSRPLTVINFLIDSISRRTFFRRLNETVKFLNELNREKFKIFDFRLHNVLDDNSLPNLFPLWTGEKLKLTLSQKNQNKDKMKDLIYDKSIWKELRENAWVTLFGVEFCNHYFAYGMGKKPKVDHLMAQFWCGARKLANFSDTLKDERCIGNKKSHEYMFDYVLQFVDSYPGLNKWAHVMMVTAHEDSGTVISTLDLDLRNFLQSLSDTSQDFLIFFGADHGMRYGEWYRSINGNQEHKFPSLFVLTTKSFLDIVPGSDEILRHNSYQLTTKYDIHKTLSYLSVLPYFNKQENHQKFAFNLMTEKIPPERKCGDANIPAEYCSCNDFQELESRFEWISEEVTKLTIEEMNKAVLFNADHADEVCQKVSLKKIIKGSWASQGKKVVIQVKFRINENDSIFESLSIIFSKSMKWKKNEETFEFVPFFLQGKAMFRLIGINSDYKYECSEKAWDKGVTPNLCICKNSNI